ncbi:MAG: type II toxin-antitoxin system RelE/ParE family toxin [Aquidulcibacter sp.]
MVDIPISHAFKTVWFAKAAKKARIDDDELWKAIEQARLGQADDLGGGVFKKRLAGNRYRSILLAKGGTFWVYSYLFAKKDRDNIDDGELKAFRDLAKIYAGMTESQVEAQIDDGHWIEIKQPDKDQMT